MTEFILFSEPRARLPFFLIMPAKRKLKVNIGSGDVEDNRKRSPRIAAKSGAKIDGDNESANNNKRASRKRFVSKYFVTRSTEAVKNDENSIVDSPPKQNTTRNRQSLTMKKLKATRNCLKKDNENYESESPVEDGSDMDYEEEIRKPKKQRKTRLKNTNISSDSESEWEEVEDVFDLDEYNPTIPERITIRVKDSGKQKKKKKGDWIAPWVRQQINKLRHRFQINIHKTNLLLLVHRLRYLNSTINDPLVSCLALSLSPPKIKVDETVVTFLEIFNQWFREHFDLKKIRVDSDCLLKDIIESFASGSIEYPLVMLAIAVALLRTEDLNVRLCYLLCPVTFKPFDLIDKYTRFVRLKDFSTANSLNFERNSKRKTLPEEPVNCEQPSWYWIEVFDSKCKRWISCDFHKQLFDEPSKIAANIGREISYILAVDNGNFVDEVTARYAEDWYLHQMRRRRLEDDWWPQTLQLLKRKDYSVFEDADVKEFDQLAGSVPIPTRLTEFKNHSLFVLQRNILKYQALYPPDAPPLGFFRDEPIYSRNCVHQLKSRQTWLRLIRSVKPNEKPYKVIATKHKWDDRVGILPEKEMVDLFGEWQTEPYRPPVAANGIVPRNLFGNVDLYDPRMLPIGTVHLKLARIQRIAAKLNIDCAPAVTGFDCNNHRGYGSRPVIEGFVICKENEPTLMEAWNKDKAYRDRRAEHFKTQRSLANWKRLIKGLLIKTRLQIKYANF